MADAQNLKSAERPKLFWSHSSYERRSFRWWSYIRGRDALRIELAWLNTIFGVSYSQHDNERTLHLGTGLIAVWVTYPGRYLSYGQDREIAIRLSGDALRWRFWCDPNSWSSSTPKWRDGSFCFLDFALGRRKCEHHTLDEQSVLIPMPERAYEATAKLEQWTWSRPRWFSETIQRVTINIPGGVPFPGKGENSWDCDDDATYGITTGPCNSIAEGVGILVGSVLRDRVRYGGYSDWSWNRP